MTYHRIISVPFIFIQLYFVSFHPAAQEYIFQSGITSLNTLVTQKKQRTNETKKKKRRTISSSNSTRLRITFLLLRIISHHMSCCTDTASHHTQQYKNMQDLSFGLALSSQETQLIRKACLPVCAGLNLKT